MANLSPDQRAPVIAALKNVEVLLDIGEWRGEAAAALANAQAFVRKLRQDAEAGDGQEQDAD